MEIKFFTLANEPADLAYADGTRQYLTGVATLEQWRRRLPLEPGLEPYFRWYDSATSEFVSDWIKYDQRN